MLTNMLTKEIVFKLLDENITVKESNDIKLKIDSKFTEICNVFFIKHYQDSWFDYYEENGFQIHDCLENISVTGEFISPPTGYDFKIPTKWLWTSIEDIKKEIKETENNLKTKKQNDKIKRKEIKEKNLKIIETIKSKLTPEELKLIKSFKA